MKTGSNKGIRFVSVLGKLFLKKNVILFTNLHTGVCVINLHISPNIKELCRADIEDLRL